MHWESFVPQVHEIDNLEKNNEPLPAKPAINIVEGTVRRLCATNKQIRGHEPHIWLPKEWYYH
jgi:hypothetical protein